MPIYNTGGVDVRRDRATHRAGEANCKRPSEGGGPQKQPTLAPSPTPRDQEVGYRNLMMLHVTSCQLRANNKDWGAQGRRRWNLGERMDEGSKPCAGGLRERCLVA